MSVMRKVDRLCAHHLWHPVFRITVSEANSGEQHGIALELTLGPDMSNCLKYKMTLNLSPTSPSQFFTL
jgi:hypothetical protein